MRLRIDIEIPNYVRWIALGLIAGGAFGYGVATVRADIVSVATWKSGDLLTAEKLNQNFADLQAAINAQQVTIDALRSPSCPHGYILDASTTGIVLCTNGRDEVVKVGHGAASFWIDRYEASIWSHEDGTGQQYGIPSAVNYPSPFPPNGQYDPRYPLYALSVAKVAPSASLTWFQASAACAASGKKLASAGEWLLAAKGTTDPGKNDGLDGSCVTFAPEPRMTGLGTRCASDWGAQDMIGNLWEYTGEWHLGLGSSAHSLPDYSVINIWPGTLFNSDFTINIASQARTNDNSGFGLPAAGQRGGAFGDEGRAGIFAIDLMSSPNYQQDTIGFRCVVPR